MNKNQEFVALESLRFLSEDMGEHEFPCPISELPFPKEKIRESIGVYLKDALEKSLITETDVSGIKTYYGFLSNFIEDEDAKLINSVNQELEKIGIYDTPAAKDWLNFPANQEREKKVAEIMSRSAKEREELRKEIDDLVSQHQKA